MIGAELQAAIYAALIGADVAGDRIYDQVPADPTFPYVTIGDEQVINDDNSCDDAWEIYSDIHLWSRPADGSKAEIKALAVQVQAAICGITTVSGFRLVSIRIETARTMRDPDGLTEHTIMTFRSQIDPN